MHVYSTSALKNVLILSITYKLCYLLLSAYHSEALPFFLLLIDLSKASALAKFAFKSRTKVGGSLLHDHICRCSCVFTWVFKSVGLFCLPCAHLPISIVLSLIVVVLFAVYLSPYYLLYRLVCSAIVCNFFMETQVITDSHL